MQARTVAFLLVLVCASPAYTQQQVVDPRFGFALILPSMWEEVNEDSVTRTFMSPQGNQMCTVKVTNDYSIGIMGIDGYISSLTAEKLRSLLRIELRDPDVHALSEYHFGGRRAVHYIYSGFLQEGKLATAGFQTIRGPYLYTLNCTCPAEIFAHNYRHFADIAASFRIQ
jgi:hypothetical protein